MLLRESKKLRHNSRLTAASRRPGRSSLENFLDPIIDIADIKTSSSSGK